MRNDTFINLAKGTFLSILFFSSISFVTVLLHISPLHYYRNDETYELAIGFPFTYYHQFWLSGAQPPNSGWWGSYLLLDVVITWLVVTVGYFLYRRRSSE